MQNENYSLRKTVCSLCIMLSFVFTPETMAQDKQYYPFFRSFLDNKLDGIRFLEPNPPESYYSPFIDGTIYRNNKATLVAGLGLRLTQQTNEVGAFFLPDYIFSTEDGMLIEFEYMIYKTAPSVVGETDGISMYLVDAQDKYIGNNLKFGAEGAGFGYTYNWSAFNNTISGMKGAYLAVALDNQNFKAMRFEGREVRNGIVFGNSIGSGTKMPYREVAGWKDLAYHTGSNVTIRGAAGQSNLSLLVRDNLYMKQWNLSEGFWGYPVLITRHSGMNSDGATNRQNQAVFMLNTATGDFTGFNENITPTLNEPFDIASQTTFTRPSEAAYRKAIINLEPNPSGGFKITVKIQHGQKESIMIQNYTFPEQLTYQENAYPVLDYGSGDMMVDNTPTLVQYSVSTPKKLVIGFGASTGFKTPYTNVIKNLRITPMCAATSRDDYYEHRRGPAIITPLNNDIAYDGNGIPSTNNLDLSTFRFWKDEYTLLPGNEQYIQGQGRWIYVPARREVMFFPDNNFTGVATIMYDIKGKAPYNGEKFRSSLAKISIDMPKNPPAEN